MALLMTATFDFFRNWMAYMASLFVAVFIGTHLTRAIITDYNDIGLFVGILSTFIICYVIASRLGSLVFLLDKLNFGNDIFEVI